MWGDLEPGGCSGGIEMPKEPSNGEGLVSVLVAPVEHQQVPARAKTVPTGRMGNWTGCSTPGEVPRAVRGAGPGGHASFGPVALSVPGRGRVRRTSSPTVPGGSSALAGLLR